MNTTALVQRAATPVVAIAVLFLSCRAFGEPLHGAYLILALLVFSLTFPGRILHVQGASRLSLAVDVLTHWLVVVALLLLLGWGTRTLDVFDERVILAWIVAAPLALIAVQLVIPRLLAKLMATDRARRVAIVAGGGEMARRLANDIGRSPHLGIRVAGYFDDRAPARLHATASDGLLGGLDQIADYARQHHVGLIYINLPMTSQPRIRKLLDELRDTTASIYFVPDILLFDLIQARTDTVGGIPVLAVCETPFYGVNAIVKRASDLVLATAILILISPLMLAIAVAIKYSSPGPVLFKQRRYGLDGREIIVYKFRSMRVCEDGGEIRQATRNDPRVTRLGAFLRSTSLDELPQFINVLQGRMSVVGPRPHAVAHNEMYRKLINGYMIRHKVRPGITGWAQVNGQRGETATLDRMQARLDYDLAYLRNWSLGLDLQIIVKTLFVVWQKQNAY
ncbi:MAG: undecaprenyl-phosphate glucose phosphotransferase [Rhodocyclaceae bacterium]|nr:undecaprenyl-phosphate glucose phosphotransferase [Rhodocyclaceae bacterium]